MPTDGAMGQLNGGTIDVWRFGDSSEMDELIRAVNAEMHYIVHAANLLPGLVAALDELCGDNPEKLFLSDACKRGAALVRLAKSPLVEGCDLQDAADVTPSVGAASAAAAQRGAQKYRIEQLYASGWSSAGWTRSTESGHELPVVYDTEEEAQKELEDFIADQHEAVDDGDMEDKYDISEYRVAPVPPDVGGVVLGAERFSAQVCVPQDWTDARIVQFATDELLSAGWCIRRERDAPPYASPERQPCRIRDGYVHVVLDRQAVEVPE
jgi:hypothetical protein